MCTHPLQCSLHLDLMFNTPSQNSPPVTSPWQNGYRTTLHCFVTEEMAFSETETHSGLTTGACWALNMLWVLLILLYSKRTDKELAADNQSVGQLFHPSMCKSSKHTRTTVGVKEDPSSVYFTPCLKKACCYDMPLIMISAFTKCCCFWGISASSQNSVAGSWSNALAVISMSYRFYSVPQLWE